MIVFYVNTPIAGDFNQLRDTFLRTQYGFNQVVQKPTRQRSILDKIWKNISVLYNKPKVLGELGTSDHCMVVLSPSVNPMIDTGRIEYVATRCMGHNEKVMFALLLSKVKWEPLYRMDKCEDQFLYYQGILNELIETCFPVKVVTRHSTDKLG